MARHDRADNLKHFQVTYPRHAWALDRMEPGEFRDSLVKAAEEGFMTPRRLMHLWHLATKLEREARGEVVLAPTKGTRGEFHLIITKAEWCDNNFGDHVYQVTFLAVEGWRGRWETTNMMLADRIEERTTDEIRLTANCKWNREDFGILGGRVQLNFVEPV